MTSRKSTNGTSNGNGSTVPATPIATHSFSPQFLPSNSPNPGGLTQSQRDEIMQLLAILQNLLPPLRDLTAEERRSLSGMGDANRTFAGKILEVVLQNPDFLPRSFDINQYQQNLETFDHLSAIARSLTQMLDLINATTTAIGSEVHDDSLVVYRYINASGQGASIEARQADLKQRFTSQGKKKKKDAEKPQGEE